MKRRVMLNALCLLLVFSNVGEAAVRLYNNHTFGDWRLYEGKDANTKVCYAVAEPYRTRAFHGIKSKSWVAITFLGRNQFTVSGHTGFDTDTSAPWILDIDGNDPIALHVLPSGEIWSYSSAQDVQIINAMMQGDAYFTVRGYSSSKQTILDYYSLKGLHKIIKYMNKNC